MRKMIEGSRAVAEAVALCRPQVISAYPITPQTHIVQELSQMIADGDLEAESVNVESEHSAASVILGASAAGVRAYTTTTSQGLLLMTEVLFNIAGLRLPVVLTCANRSISAPLNIWNDQQDSYTVRDAGLIQLHAENNQEAADLIYQAYRLGEDHRVLLPVMVCMDGFILTHAYEGVEIPTQAEVDAFLPPFDPPYRLDPEHPLSLGAYAEPDKYMESRYMIEKAMDQALVLIPQIADQFRQHFGRPCGGLVERYRSQHASTLVVAMGSVVATIKEAVDELREQGLAVGAVKVVSFRPLPRQALFEALEGAENVVVLEKAVSLGGGGPLATEIKALFHGKAHAPRISSVIAGLGGRDIDTDSIKRLVTRVQREVLDGEFWDLRTDLELEGVA